MAAGRYDHHHHQDNLVVPVIDHTTVRVHGPKRRMIVFLEISSLQDGMVFYGCGPVIGLI